jgi:hypothetical protein
VGCDLFNIDEIFFMLNKITLAKPSQSAVVLSRWRLIEPVFTKFLTQALSNSNENTAFGYFNDYGLAGLRNHND